MIADTFGQFKIYGNINLENIIFQKSMFFTGLLWLDLQHFNSNQSQANYIPLQYRFDSDQYPHC